MRAPSFIILFIVLPILVNSQVYFNKYLEPIDSLNPNPTGLKEFNSEILVTSLYSGNLTGLVRLKIDGTEIENYIYSSFASSSETILNFSDSLFLWGKNREKEKGLELLQIDEDFDIIATQEIESNGVWNFPATSNVFGDSIVALSVFRDEGSDILRGTVHMIAKDLEQVWSKQLHPESSFVNVFNSLELSSGNLLVSSQYSSDDVNGSVTLFNKTGIILRQKDMPEEITSGYAVTIVELSNGDIICGTVVDRLFDWEFQQNEWFEQPTKYYWLSGDNLQEQKDTIYINSKFERPGGEKLWKGNGDYFFIYGHIWFFDEDQTYGMLKKVDNDGNILWSRRYQHEDFTGDNNFHGIEHIQEMPDGSIYTAGSARFTGGRNHIWIMHLDENGCLGDDCGEVVITDVENVAESISDITVFPNPAIELLTVDNLDYNKSYTYEIVDSSGSKAKKGEITLSELFHINIKILIPGIYTLQLKEKPTGKYTSLRFVVL